MNDLYVFEYGPLNYILQQKIFDKNYIYMVFHLYEYEYDPLMNVVDGKYGDNNCNDMVFHLYELEYVVED